MNILAIETTGFEASVAVINEQEEVFEETSSQKTEPFTESDANGRSVAVEMWINNRRYDIYCSI